MGCQGVVACVEDAFPPLLSLRPLVVGGGIVSCAELGTDVS